jgi:hypothetical protein
MKSQKITEFYTEWFSVCPDITSEFCIVAIFESFVKETNDLLLSFWSYWNYSADTDFRPKCFISLFPQNHIPL